MDETDRYKSEIVAIISGRTHYGQVPIEEKRVTKNLRWIGENGYTASVGQWIRQIRRLIDNGKKVTRGFRWYTIVDVLKDGTKQCMWYFGIEIDREIIYVCGGCTDFSGEGGRGRKLADCFLTCLLAENFIIERNADYLISLLTCSDD